MKRRLAIVALACCAVLGGLAVAFTASGAAQTGAPEAPSPQKTLRQCLSGTNRLEVLFLIDESGSLEANDPSNQRVGGVKAALAGLSQLAATQGTGPKPVIDVLFASFAGEVRPDPADSPPSAAWKPLTEASVRDLQNAADVYAERNTGHNTDYLKALTAARELLSQRAFTLAKGNVPPPCKLLIWFTDGAYQISGDPGAVEAGRQELCKPGGEVDRLAKDNVVTLTVGLKSGLDDTQERRLRAMTEGSIPGESCGTVASPATGLYRSAAESSQLFLELGDLLNDNPRPKSPPVCVRIPCPEGYVRFTTVNGVTRFVIRASTGAEGIQIALNGPTGPPVRFVPRATDVLTVAGTRVTQSWVSGTDVTLTGTLDTARSDGVGAWWFAFVDPVGTLASSARPGYRVQVFADLAPALAGGSFLVRGEAKDLAFSIVDAQGRPVTSGPLVEGATLDVTDTDPITNRVERASVRPLGSGRFSARIAVPAGSSAGEMYVDADLRFDTPAGVEVVAQPFTELVPVRFPPDGGYPSVTPVRLHLPAIKDDGSSSADLTATGSTIGGGCVWFGQPRIERSDDRGQLTITVAGEHTSRERCLRVERGQAVKLPVTAKVQEPFTGRATATIPVMFMSDRRPQVLRLDVEADVEVSKSPNTQVLVVVFVLLALVSVLLPIGVLLFLNWWTARFTPEQRVSWYASTVRLREGSGLEALVDGEWVAPDVRPRQFEILSRTAGESRKRSLPVDRDFALKTVGSFGPRGKLAGVFLGPYGFVSVKERRVIAGSDERLERYDTASEVPLDLPGTWIFYPTKRSSGSGEEGGAGPGIEGRLVLLTSEDRRGEGADLLVRAQAGIAALWRDHDVSEPQSGGSWRRPWRFVRDRLGRRDAEPEPAAPDASAPAGGDAVPPRKRGFLG